MYNFFSVLSCNANMQLYNNQNNRIPIVCVYIFVISTLYFWWYLRRTYTSNNSTHIQVL